MIIDLTSKLKGEKRVRKLNRFSCSEMYYLLQGWTTLDDYVNGKEKTVQDYYTMAMGTAKHQMIQEWLKDEYQVEVKKELTFGEIEIVGVADLLHLEPLKDVPTLQKPDYGIEIKTSTRLKEKSSGAHDFQAKMYCSIFDVPYFIIMQPVLKDGKCILKEIGRVKKSDIFFNNQIKKLTELYQQLKTQYAK